MKIPIGRPIFNTSAYIVDPCLNLLPVGVPGELCIGGSALARGYLNRPELMAKKFVPNPFNLDPNSQLYRTGDLARYLLNGKIEFLGRMDDQIKVRGFRIELGEIENAIMQHPLVRTAVVTAQENSSGVKQLVGYIARDSELERNQLRYFLKRKLPSYMVPTELVLLDTFPLTPNGKVDRKTLDTRRVMEQATKPEFISPRTAIEATMCDIWSELLKIESVGVNSDFFELGGHSLLAAQLVTRIRDNFQVELPLVSIFEAPTAAELAAQVTLESATQTSSKIKNMAYDDVAALLDELETLSDREVQQISRLKT